MIELLVVLDERNSALALETVKNRFQVSSTMQPRLAVVIASDAAQTTELLAIPGVLDVIADPGSPIPESLNETEKLFAGAWQMRQTLNRKTRVGEGLSWDAPGFLPPD